MDRRNFLKESGKAMAMVAGPGWLHLAPPEGEANELMIGQGDDSAPTPGNVLAGTTALTASGDLAAQMVDGIHRFLQQRTEQGEERQKLWHRDTSSREKYDKSVEPNRERFRRIIGAVDSRSAAPRLHLLGEPLPRTDAGRFHYQVQAVRWSVCDAPVADSPGLIAEGLLLQPEGKPLARVVAIPDADWTPEMLAGLAGGVEPDAQFARLLAANGCQVVVPLLLNRDDTYSGIPGVGMTNQPHREWIYRMAFEVGRHIIGFEVQKVLAVIDGFARQNVTEPTPLAVAGYGEGGLIALYAAALDRRIDAALVSGYFQERTNVSGEPIYRDVWGLLREFADADLASLIAPRVLIVEACRGPQVDGPPPVTDIHKASACPNGTLGTPPIESVRREVERARPYFSALNAVASLHLAVSGNGTGLPGCEDALQSLLAKISPQHPLERPANLPTPSANPSETDARLRRQFQNLVEFTQGLIRLSPTRRAEFWRKADASSAERWKESTRSYRDFIWEEVIGRLPDPVADLHPRTRVIYDTPSFRGYEVMLDAWPEVFAYGILLVPRNLKPGERRPVVVCQHGLEGRPQEVMDPQSDSPYYHRFGARLAEEGFVTYAPQNPYIGEDRFRTIQRLGHPLKLSLFSFILGQHQQTLRWLAQQPFVDPARIGFYGLSYGGKTAVRVPPLLDEYALSICSADFNEWVWKTTNVLSPYSYMLLGEYDMYEFNFANVVNYGELGNLMAPRPFMVERGHDDPVGMDEWVAFEYAKVRRFYDKMGISDRTRIEFFEGPHTIHGVGTFEFLRKHLKLDRDIST
jgi:dienelactone hydrolase